MTESENISARLRENLDLLMLHSATPGFVRKHRPPRRRDGRECGHGDPRTQDCAGNGRRPKRVRAHAATPSKMNVLSKKFNFECS